MITRKSDSYIKPCSTFSAVRTEIFFQLTSETMLKIAIRSSRINSRPLYLFTNVPGFIGTARAAIHMSNVQLGVQPML